MKSIHILIRVNTIEHLFFINMFGKRKLYKDAVDGIVLVVSIDQVKELLLGDILRLIVLYLLEAEAIRGLDFGCDIRDGRRIFSDKYGYEAGDYPVFSLYIFYLLFYLVKYLIPFFRTFEQFSSHYCSPYIFLDLYLFKVFPRRSSCYRMSGI